MKLHKIVYILLSFACINTQLVQAMRARERMYSTAARCIAYNKIKDVAHFKSLDNRLVVQHHNRTLSICDKKGKQIVKHFAHNVGWFQIGPGKQFVVKHLNNTLSTWCKEGNLIAGQFVRDVGQFKANPSIVVHRNGRLSIWGINGQQIVGPFASNAGRFVIRLGNRIVTTHWDSLSIWNMDGNKIAEIKNVRASQILLDKILVKDSDNNLKLFDMKDNSMGEPFASKVLYFDVNSKNQVVITHLDATVSIYDMRE